MKFEKIQVYSEIGKLNSVIVHRPGYEINALHPAFIEKLLFDYVPYLKEIQRSHDIFTGIMRSKNIKVYYIEKMLMQALLNAKDSEKFHSFIKRFTKLLVKQKYEEIYLQAIKPFIKNLHDWTSSEALVNFLMKGLSKEDCGMSIKEGDWPYIADPLANILFQRDPYTTLGNKFNIHKMRFRTRKAEAMACQFALEYSHTFNKEAGYLFLTDPESDEWIAMEGGDALMISEELLLLANSERTPPGAGAKLFQALQQSETNKIKRVLELAIPPYRECMHLDTVLTQVDVDKFIAYKPYFGDDIILEATEHTQAGAKAIHSNLRDYLSSILQKPVTLIFVAESGNAVAQAREQKSDGANVLTIKPGEVIAYDRNELTNKALRAHGIKVYEVPSSELVTAAGGPRCMSMPINRDLIE